jgi:hypothetical protein
MALNLIQLFENKNPTYPTMYRDLLNQVATFGGDSRSEEKRNKQGRAFSNGYEVFMYAAILGITRDEQLPTEGLSKERFNVYVKDWKPIEMARFLFMSVIAKSPNIDLLALESMAEEEVKEQVNNLTNLLEQYACGGFSIMQNAIQQNPDYYRQEDFFLQLLM